MTLTLAIIAIVLSASSLGWQAWSWWRDGPVIRLSSVYAMPVFGPPGAQEFGDDYIQVTVANNGRAPATLKNWGIDLGNKRNAFPGSPLSWTTPLGSRIEPHSSAQLAILVDEARRISREERVPYDKMRPWVELGNGKQVRSRKGLPLAD